MLCLFCAALFGYLFLQVFAYSLSFFFLTWDRRCEEGEGEQTLGRAQSGEGRAVARLLLLHCYIGSGSVVSHHQ